MIKKTIFGLIFFFLLMSNVFGMTLKPSGDIQGVPGKEVTIYLNFTKTTEEEALTGLEGVLSYDENILTLKSQEKLLGESWTYYSVVNNKKFAFLNLIWSDETLLNSTNTNISKLTFLIDPNASGTTNLTISNLEAADRNGNSVSINGGSHVIKILSNVNTLSSIKINGVNVANFDPNKTEYSETVDAENINIEAVKTDSKSTVTGIGNQKLNYGLNTLKIIVTSELGTKKEYILNITRKDNRSSVNTLSSIKINGVNVANFDPNKTEYSETVDAENINIEAVKTDSKSTVTGIGNQKLNYGLNTLKIIVTSELGTKKEYILNITRKDNRSSVNTLKSLSLSTGEINFDPSIKTYNIKVDETVDKVKITSELTDRKSSYVTGYANREVILKKGSNQVLIKIQAENGSINTYTLYITRENNEELVIEKNANIKELIISNYEINFSNDIYEYNISINDENSLEIQVLLEDSNATYEVLNNENLDNGSIITIKVVSSDKTITKEYNIIVEKEDSSLSDEDIENDDNQNINDDLEDVVDDKTQKNFNYIIGISIFIIVIVLFIIGVKSQKDKWN